ncbi:MAG: hypothetical protein M1813_008997 [Trichoglossum hirsutum]|nr:MAG: hypothetical protein M1813_008997 [Trichoglossum hirsutum]
MADNTNTALISFRKNLRGGRRCSPEDLEALGIRIALGQQADCPSRGDGPTASGPTEDIKKIFESLQHARMRPTAQDLVETRSIPALTTYCGLELVKVYDDKFDKLELAVGKKKYTMPKLERPTSYAKELTLGRGRISTVYLPRIHAEDNCVVYAREMFCLFAMAEKSSRECPEDQYLVGVVTLWNELQLRMLAATIPASFLKNLNSSRALASADIVVKRSPFFNPTEPKDWEMVKAWLHGHFYGAIV